VYVLPADGAAQETEIARDAQMMGWSPDGTSLLFSRERANESQLFLVAVSGGRASGESRALHTASNVGTSLGVTQDGRLFYRLDNRHADGWLATLDLQAGRLTTPHAQFTADKIQIRMNDNDMKFSPDGRQVLWITPPNQILIRTVSGDRQVTVTPQMKEVKRVEWSHDGNSLLLGGIGADGRDGLYNMDLAGGAATFLIGNLGLEWQVAFVPSRDGKTIYFRTAAGKLASYDVASRSERIIFDDFAKVPNIALSHDGKALALRSGGTLGILDLASGQYKRLYTRDYHTDDHVMWGLDWTADDRNVVAVARDFATAKSDLWIYPVNGGAPTRQPMGGDFRGIAISPDRKVAATVRVAIHHQVWSLDNFLPAKK
jgi:Tol biopolymer transport system component